MMRWLAFVSLLVASPAWAQFSFPTAPGGVSYQINGVAQSGVTTVNAPAGSTLSGGVLSVSGSGGSTFASLTVTNTTNQFAIGGGGKITTFSVTQPAASFTLTFPDAGSADSVAYLALAQTFTNKTFSGGTFSGTIAGTPTLSGNLTFSGAPVFSGGASATGSANFNLGGSSGSFTAPTGTSTISTLSVTGTSTLQSTVAMQAAVQESMAQVADANTASSSTVYIAYTSITAARTVTTPCSLGATNKVQVYIVKDQSGNASGTNTITLQPSSGTIDGAASKVLVNSAFGSARFYSNGTNCFTW